MVAIAGIIYHHLVPLLLSPYQVAALLVPFLESLVDQEDAAAQVMVLMSACLEVHSSSCLLAPLRLVCLLAWIVRIFVCECR